MFRIRSIVLAASALVAAAHGQGTVVNVDVGNGAGTYSGQGVIDDLGNDFWNGIENAGSNLIASDGVTGTGVSVNLVAGDGFQYGNANTLLGDYQYVSSFFGPVAGEITIAGLLSNTGYLIYVFSAGDNVEQGGIVTLNGVTGCTAGSTSDQFMEGVNYVLLDVESDASGAITGTWGGFDAFAAINGFQIAEGSLPPQVLSIAGAESPTVHSSGDVIPVELSFNDVVTLSQLGGAEIELDFDGTLVNAVHTGAFTGTTLNFDAVAPSVTTMNAKVVANSLQLLGGATLLDGSLSVVGLGHDEVALPNDQVSVAGLSVYPAVPGLSESPHFRFRVREIGGAWQSSFAWFTKCIDDAPVVPYGYYNASIGGWSHSYCNFEMANNVPIEVEISRLDPMTGAPVDIEKAVPHPRRKVMSWRVENGKAYVLLERPTLFAVDIDGQLDENPTPSSEFINENAIHAVSIFANPFILDKPDLADPNVLAVDPGVIPPNDGPWTTLYFKPGVHQLLAGPVWQLGDDFRLRSDRSYYIPGDAIVHGNMNNRDESSDARNIRVFGHGTLSGERIDHSIELGIPEVDDWRSRAIRIASNAKGCRVEGLTIADPANHSCALVGGFNASPEDFNYVRWCKAITWRANGDGISPNGSGFVEDCFLRTQDDGTYVLGLGIRRIVYWTDVNGMPLRCSFLTARNPAPYKDQLIVEDIDVIYARSGFGPGPGRSIIGYPDPAPAVLGNNGSRVLFRNISVEDPFPARTLFGWDIQTGVGGVSSVRFENIRMAAPTVEADPDVFLGGMNAPIEGLIFDDVMLAGEHYDSSGDFSLNSFVNGLLFESTAPETTTYQNASGYGKWYIHGDWDAGVEPANNDIVQHTAVAGVLTVDAPAYAGTLNIAHAGTATVAVETGGRLTIRDGITIGGSGAGLLQLDDGVVRIMSNASSALSSAAGGIHMEKGKIRWAGDHISDIQALYAAGAITFSNGGGRRASLRGSVRIGKVGTSALNAHYSDASGYTTVWVIEG